MTLPRNRFFFILLYLHEFFRPNVDFTGEWRQFTRRFHITTCDTFNNCGYAWDDKKKQWIPPNLEDPQRDFGFWSIKPIFRRGFGDDESYHLANDDAPKDISMPSMDDLQTVVRIAFEYFA